jgi:lipid-A-disaccharide synthase
MAVSPPARETVAAATNIASARRILIVAGEASGDHLGGDVAAQLRALTPNCDIFGVAGEHMRAAGVRPLIKLESVAGMGGTELASTIGPVLSAFRTLVTAIRRKPPDLVILVDFADFNLKLAWFAKRAGVPVLYYVPPQVWAWRRWRIHTLVRRSDRIAVVFPFEAELYAKAGGRVSFVGHPLLDRVATAQDRSSTLAQYGFAPRGRLLAVLPGSRRGEIRHLLRPMLEAARVLAADHDLEPVIALASTLTLEDLRAAAGAEALAGIRVIEGDTYSMIAASEIALVASGTATLEAALLGCPMVIAYKLSALSYLVGRILIKGVDFIGLPNLLAGRRLVPELIQYQVTPVNLVRAAEPLLAPALHSEIATQLRALRERLGPPGAAARVASMALEMIG